MDDDYVFSDGMTGKEFNRLKARKPGSCWCQYCIKPTFLWFWPLLQDYRCTAGRHQFNDHRDLNITVCNHCTSHFNLRKEGL